MEQIINRLIELGYDPDMAERIYHQYARKCDYDALESLGIIADYSLDALTDYIDAKFQLEIYHL